VAKARYRYWKEDSTANLHKDDPDERGSTRYYNGPSWTTMKPSSELQKTDVSGEPVQENVNFLIQKTANDTDYEVQANQSFSKILTVVNNLDQYT